MPTVVVEAQLSIEELLKAVEQLSLVDLEAFVDRVLALQARRRWPNLSQAETELLLEINREFPADLRQRYDELAAKRKANNLTSEEYSELLRLSDRIEMLQAQRIGRVSELARLRQVPLETLMDELGITPRDHA